MYRFFTDEVSVKVPKLLELESDNSSWGTRGKSATHFKSSRRRCHEWMSKTRKLLLSMAEGMARRGAKG